MIAEADAIFWLVDASNPQESLGQLESSSLPSDRTWYLFNKMDLLGDKRSWEKKALLQERCLELSCETGEGLQKVVEKLEDLVRLPLGGENVILTSLRHQQEAQTAYQALEALQGLMKEKQPYELWAEELKTAALAIGRIRGRNLPANAFEEIFSKFCIGK